MTADARLLLPVPAVIDRRCRNRRNDPIIQRFGLESPSLTRRTGGVRAITAEQNADMHFVSLALEPFEKTPDAVPAVILGQLFDVRVVVARFPVNDEILVRFR